MQYLNQLLHLPPPAPWSDRPKASAPGLMTWQDVCCFCRPQWPPKKNMMHFGIFGFMLLVFSPLGMNDMNLDQLGYISISNFEAGEFEDVWKKPAAGGWRYLIITFIPPLWKAIQESHWLGDMSLHPPKNNWQASARNSHASTYMHIAAHFTHINLTKILIFM